MVAKVDLFEVLADPTRRRIVELMRKRECSVSELVDGVAIHQPGVSRHLRILRDAGFVAVRRDRQRRLYSLRAGPFRALAKWMHSYEHLLAEQYTKLDSHLDGMKQDVEL